jgi:RNA polymerase sigma factor (sigma-70 family)
MTAWAWAALCFIGAALISAVGDLVSEEIRGWLDLLPRCILRLAAARLDADQRSTVYKDEWLPELCHVLRGAESRPITRLIRGVTFAIGLLIAARRIAREISRDVPAPPIPLALPNPLALPAALALPALPRPVVKPAGKSFESFYAYYYPRLTKFLQVQARDVSVAEEIAQDAMLHAYDRWDDLLTYERPDSWVFKMAIKMLRGLEARARLQPRSSEDSDNELGIKTGTDENLSDLRLDLAAALKTLPRRQAEVISLRFFSDLTLAETAKLLGLTESTARYCQRAGLAKLRQKLDPGSGQAPSLLRGA